MPKRNPPVEVQDGQREEPAGTEPRRSKSAYAVYMANGMGDDAVATELGLIAVVTAENATAARWAAVDSDKVLQAKARADADGEPPLLLALAARFAKPVATREEQTIQTKRR